VCGRSQQETCNISEMGQDMTNRKSHTRFRLVPKSTTLSPWMTLKGHYALCFKTRASLGAHRGNLNEGRPILLTTPLDSGNIRFMRIFAVVLEIYVNFLLYWPTKHDSKSGMYRKSALFRNPVHNLSSPVVIQ